MTETNMLSEDELELLNKIRTWTISSDGYKLTKEGKDGAELALAKKLEKMGLVESKPVPDENGSRKYQHTRKAYLLLKQMELEKEREVTKRTLMGGRLMG